jgi:hypothetical protein
MRDDTILYEEENSKEEETYKENEDERLRSPERNDDHKRSQ